MEIGGIDCTLRNGIHRRWLKSAQARGNSADADADDVFADARGRPGLAEPLRAPDH